MKLSLGSFRISTNNFSLNISVDFLPLFLPGVYQRVTSGIFIFTGFFLWIRSNILPGIIFGIPPKISTEFPSEIPLGISRCISFYFQDFSQETLHEFVLRFFQDLIQKYLLEYCLGIYTRIPPRDVPTNSSGIPPGVYTENSPLVSSRVVFQFVQICFQGFLHGLNQRFIPKFLRECNQKSIQ